MQLYQEALEIKKSCLGEDSDDVVNTLKNIAQVMVKAGKERDALQLALHDIHVMALDAIGTEAPGLADDILERVELARKTVALSEIETN